jgi:hypothetical protein
LGAFEYRLLTNNRAGASKGLESMAQDSAQGLPWENTQLKRALKVALECNQDTERFFLYPLRSGSSALHHARVNKTTRIGFTLISAKMARRFDWRMVLFPDGHGDSSQARSARNHEGNSLVLA